MTRPDIAAALALFAVAAMLSIGAALWLPIIAAQREDARINADVNAILAHMPPVRR